MSVLWTPNVSNPTLLGRVTPTETALERHTALVPSLLCSSSHLPCGALLAVASSREPSQISHRADLEDPHRGLYAMSPAETPLSSPSLRDPLNNRPQVSPSRVSLISPWLQHGCRLHMSPVWEGNEGFPTHPINLSNCCEPPPPPPVA